MFSFAIEAIGLILSSPTRSTSVPLVDQIKRTDAMRLIQAPEGLRRSSDDHLEMKATDLLRSVINIVHSYTDDDFEDLLKAIREKIEQIDNPDTKLVELKGAILTKLKDLQAGGGASGAKGDLGSVLERLQDARYGERAVKLDSADKREAALKILTSLNDLDAYRYKSKRTEISLSDVVRRGMEALAALLAAQAPRRAPPTTSTSTSTAPAPPLAPSARAELTLPASPQALGELLLMSLLSLPKLSKVRLQLVKEREVNEPNQ